MLPIAIQIQTIKTVHQFPSFPASKLPNLDRQKRFQPRYQQNSKLIPRFLNLPASKAPKSQHLQSQYFLSPIMPLIVPYVIAWIATNDLSFNGLYQTLRPTVANSVWRDDTVPIAANGLTEYTYTHGEINDHVICLANAGHEDNVARLADIMVRQLKMTGVYVRMFMVSSIGFMDDYAYVGVPLTTKDCLLDTFPVGTAKVRAEARSNAFNLLTAAANYQNSRARTNYPWQSYPLYDVTDEDLQAKMCQVNDFHGMPCMAFFGVCNRDDVSEYALQCVYRAVGNHMAGVIEHLLRLESTVRNRP
jgi:hypothetical protein